MIIGIVVLFVVGQAIAAFTSTGFLGNGRTETFPAEVIEEFEEWEEWDPGEVGHIELPGGFSDDTFVGPVWLPIPDGWTQDLVMADDESEILTLAPEGSGDAQLRLTWAPESPFQDSVELCFSTLSELTADAEDSSIDDNIETWTDTMGPEAARCSGHATSGAETTEYEATAFINQVTTEALVAVAQRPGGEPADEDFDAWARYLTCSTGDQMGVLLTGCAAEN